MQKMLRRLLGEEYCREHVGARPGEHIMLAGCGMSQASNSRKGGGFTYVLCLDACCPSDPGGPSR